MIPQTSDRRSAPETLRALYAPVGTELEEVEAILHQELCSQHPFIDELAKHGFRLGGKRMRPALVLLCARAAGSVKHDHLLLAAVVELIHTATLIHDDVLDEATLRRHLETINARWDNEASVLLGDYLLTRSICLAASIDGGHACRLIAAAGRTVCEGELRQIGHRGNYDLSEEDYLDIIAAKTAALTACCCELGAYYAGAPPTLMEHLVRYGKYLGIAFQIVDDLLDVVGDEATAGKSLGTDLVKQKPTLPLIRMLQQTDSSQRRAILGILHAEGNHRRDALRPWLERCDAIDYARQKALGYAQAARDQLPVVPAGPARQALAGLTEFVTARKS